jgi:peptide/nickel transport system substrate-binding protein
MYRTFTNRGDGHPRHRTAGSSQTSRSQPAGAASPRPRLSKCLLVAMLAGCVIVPAVTAPLASASEAQKPVLKLMASYSNNDPATGGDLNDVYGVSLAYAALIHVSPSGSLVPELAANWHYVGASHKVFEFTLRRGARFSDGSPVTARSVATWLSYFSKKSDIGSQYGKVSSIKAVGSLTVRISDSAPNPVFPYMLSDQADSGFVASGKCATYPSLFNSHPQRCSSGE